MSEMPCPKCGRPMEEQRNFPGLWMCPDAKVRLNDAPPFQFKCDGMYITESGARAFEEEVWKHYGRRN